MKTKKKVIIGLTLIALTAAGCNKATNTSNGSNNDQSGQASSNKFADQTYYKNSYLISGDTLGADAQKALNGFVMTKTPQAGGSTKILLQAKKAGYQDQEYTLTQGQQLYFVELFPADDDNEAQEDRNLGDDHAVVVDSQGNVVNGPSTWSSK